jgi:hypothetical protein
MITCPFCSKAHPDNTIFCDECGNYLLEKNRPETDPLEDQIRSSIGSSTGELRLPVDQAGPGPRSIRLLIEHGLREVELGLDKGIHLGRVDPLSDTYPEVDLTDVGGVEKGVSRRHARIVKQASAVIVEDLGSINGTFINGQKLASYTAEVLEDGDFLQLGKLIIQVKLE